MACCADFIYPTRQFPAGLHLAPGGVLPLLYTPGRGFIRVVWNKARFLMQRFLHSSCPYFHLDRRCNFLCIECLPGLFLRTFIREIPKSPQPCFLPEVIDSSAIVLEPIIQFAVDVGLRHALSFRHGRVLQFFVKSIFKMVIDYHLIAGLCFLFASIKRGVRFLPHLPVQAGMKLCYVIVANRWPLPQTVLWRRRTPGGRFPHPNCGRRCSRLHPAWQRSLPWTCTARTNPGQ